MKNVRQADVGESPPPSLPPLYLWGQEGDRPRGEMVRGRSVCVCVCICVSLCVLYQVAFQTLRFVSFFQAPPCSCILGTSSPCSPRSAVHLTLSSPLSPPWDPFQESASPTLGMGLGAVGMEGKGRPLRTMEPVSPSALLRTWIPNGPDSACQGPQFCSSARGCG